MFFGELLLETYKFELFQKIYLFADTAFLIGAKIASIFNLEISGVDDGDWSGITVDIFHTFHIVNGYEITSTIVMRVFGSNPTFIGVGNVLDGNAGQLLAAMVHVPLLPKITDHNARISKLTCVEYHSFLFLLPDGLIN